MASAVSADQGPVPPPSYHRTVATALHLDALTLVRRLQGSLAPGASRPPGPHHASAVPVIPYQQSTLVVAMAAYPEEGLKVGSPTQFVGAPLSSTSYTDTWPPRFALLPNVRRAFRAIAANNLVGSWA